VLALVNATSAMASDSYSAQVATTALTAVVPAWLAAGRDPSELLRSITDALPGVPAHRRLPLLATMVAAMPAGQALPIALLLLLQQSAAAPRRTQQQQQQQQGGAQQEAAGAWAEDLAAALCLQVRAPPGDACTPAVSLAAASTSCFCVHGRPRPGTSSERGGRRPMRTNFFARQTD
jgi:hypothetical protein